MWTQRCEFLSIDFFRRAAFAVVFYSVQNLAEVHSETLEVCQSETFQPSCPAGHIIVMEFARYGRMAMGRCVIADVGDVGCFKDVLDLADGRCSGQRTCEIRVPNRELDATQPCFSEFKAYLEVGFSCIQVATSEKNFCNSKLTSLSDLGHLSSLVADETDCGSIRSPWTIEGLPGQRINITLVDFGATNQQATSTNVQGIGGSRARNHEAIQLRCSNPLGYVSDLNSKSNQSFCSSGDNQRIRHVYLSKKNIISISLLKRATTDQGRKFLLRYKIIGCPDLIAPPNAWYTRDGDRATIGCKEAARTWQLTCSAYRWSGVIGNCTTHVNLKLASSREASTSTLSKEITIIVLISLAAFVALFTLTVGIVCFVRSKRSSGSREHFSTYATPSCGEAKYAYMCPKEDEQYVQRQHHLQREHVRGNQLLIQTGNG